MIFSSKSSRVGKAISDSSLIGVPSCFSGGRENREVDEVDRRVRLQHVSPGALAGMRLAGDEEHAKVLAHHVDLGDGDVVLKRQLVLAGLNFELDDRAAGMAERHVDQVLVADGDGIRRDFGAVDPEMHGDGGPRLKVRVEHAVLHVLRLAEDGEAGRPVEHDAAVVLAFLAGDQRMDRGVEAERVGVLGNVVDDAVGDEDGAGDLIGRHVVDQLGQLGEERGAVAVGTVGGVHLAKLEAAERVDARLQRLHGLLCLRGCGRRASGWRCRRRRARRRRAAGRAPRAGEPD